MGKYTIETCPDCGSRRNHLVDWKNPPYTICEDCGAMWDCEED